MAVAGAEPDGHIALPGGAATDLQAITVFEPEPLLTGRQFEGTGAALVDFGQAGFRVRIGGGRRTAREQVAGWTEDPLAGLIDAQGSAERISTADEGREFQLEVHPGLGAI